MDKTINSQLRMTVPGGTLEHKESGAVIPIDDEPRTIGRGSSSHLRLSDRRVSAVHCEVFSTPTGAVVRDLGSTNGTLIGGFRLFKSHALLPPQPAIIGVGDSVLWYTPGAAVEKQLSDAHGLFDSRSPVMRRILDQAEKIARITVPVHITGESGTGKEWLARAIHNLSSRASKAFTIIDCTGIPHNLAEAELFGYAAGSFTGATKRKESPFIVGDGGSIFIDEVGDLPPEIQPKLLRAVDAQEIKSVGDNDYRKFDARIISATLHDLPSRVNNDKLFREDLYSRLTAVHIELPPLRERPEDIEPLVERLCIAFKKPEAIDAISSATIAWMKSCPWKPGNVRQLRQVLETALQLWPRHGEVDVRGAYRMNGGAVHIGHARTESNEDIAYAVLTAQGTDREAVGREAERILLERVFRETNGNVSEMNRRTGASRDYLRDFLSAAGLRPIPPRHRKT